MSRASLVLSLLFSGMLSSTFSNKPALTPTLQTDTCGLAVMPLSQVSQAGLPCGLRALR